MLYKQGRQSPVLGDEEFREQLVDKSIRLDREHARHERAVLRPSVNRVLKVLAQSYHVKVDDLLKSRRGTGNEPRRVGMYLVKELCDLKLHDRAERFGIGSYGAVGWACHGVESRMKSDARFCDRVGSIRQYCQQKA
jgi:chromosomal replication initiation ATPase DnaA